MKSVFSNPSSATGQGGVLHVCFDLACVEHSGEETAVLGFQIFDPDTEAYVCDGEHRPLALPSPDEAISAEVLLAPQLLPRGRLTVIISLLTESGWRYLQGDRYVRARLRNDGETLTLEELQIRSSAMESLPRLGRLITRAFALPVRTIARNHALIRTMVWRDILGRYRGSFGGVFWSVLNPLLLMVTYYFVFGVVLRARFAGDPSREGFALYFLAGMLPWLPFSEAAGRASSVLVEHSNFIKKLIFPVETLPINLVASGLFLQGFAVVIFLLGLLAFRGSVPLSVVWLPALLIPQILLTAGLCWLLSALGLLFRDLAQISGFLLTLWFFLTPICYPEESLPGEVLPLIALNPFFHLVRAFRAVLLQGTAPDWNSYLLLLAGTLILFVAGHALFHRLRRSFADLL